MAWLVGIDEAGYGPNLGPFVMTAVACRVPDAGREANLWQRLAPVVRRSQDKEEGQLFIDDSKLVYTRHGLAGLERGLLTTLWQHGFRSSATLANLIDWACPEDRAELEREVWYRGLQDLPVHLTPDDLEPWAMRFADACTGACVDSWRVRSVIVCPARFNALLDSNGSKGHVLADALTHLLRWLQTNLEGEDVLVIQIDKHGGRNTYAAMIQHALPACMIVSEQESTGCSAYRLHGLGREVRLTFQPRADSAHLCVALASMASKYLRELLMLEFNRFWLEHVPDLRPTAGYPGDSTRFFEAIRPVIAKLGLREESLWRRK
jgi:ribonuclease HII